MIKLADTYESENLKDLNPVDRVAGDREAIIPSFTKQISEGAQRRIAHLSEEMTDMGCS